MRAPKIFWNIVFGLPVLFIVLFLAQNKVGQGVADGLPQPQGPQIRQSGFARVISATGRPQDISLDPAKALRESRLARTDVRPALREPAPELMLSHPTIYSLCGRYVARVKSQSEDYRERAFNLYQLLIFPHHWFW